MKLSKTLFPGIAAVIALAPLALTAAPASAAPGGDPDLPWRRDHWPQIQPWQRDQPDDAQALHGRASRVVAPIDPQNWKNPDHMTWADYKKIPGTDWANPATKGSVRTFKGALVLVDYPNQPFVVTQPQNSTVFGNPSAQAHDIPRDKVAKFYQDFLNTPNQLNKGHTLHEYWMEDSGGRYGVDLTAFGPYRMPGKSHEYAMEYQRDACPAGDNCNRNLRADGNAAWLADVGKDVASQFDFVFYLSAGQDESSTWQEFGMMKFPTKEAVTDDFGPPDPNLPNWSRTRYVEWTSWAAGSTFWPNANIGVDSVQAESSGQGVFAHEFSHILGVLDNYNNPYGNPPVRAYTGIWEMLSRGSFNGPGGPHSRWLIPPTAGASMGAQHMLRNKIKLGMVDEENVLRLSREALRDSGLVVAKVTAREIQPGKGGLTGVNISFDTGDKSTGSCSQRTDPLCDGGNYDNYTVEVVDRIGSDSFTPDSGVLLAKTKNQDRAPFEWVIDANPQDIQMTDYVLPDGTKVPITIGDYRQLADALFHAGTDSGSEYEYVDQANRLHFYVTDVRRDAKGTLSYTVAIRSLDGAGPQKRGVKLLPGAGVPAAQKGVSMCSFPLFNTGKAASAQGQHPEDVSAYLNSDVYRLKAEVEGNGWTTITPNALAAVDFGGKETVTVFAQQSAGGSRHATVKLTATSESDPSTTMTATCHVNAV
ncbi:M6 family metalloprotease domain-containing protein [Microbispora sp. NPDC046933]|uniref:M6 family metalloprotease domain-containing protein n=1 Tax=Microbispora sp. NPDC046933 TaxID=3155618 RepID=UPI0033FB2895